MTKAMKMQELLGKSDDQLKSKIEEAKKESMNLRFQLKSGSLTNTSRVKFVRKKIAKIKTLLNNKQPKKVGVE